MIMGFSVLPSFETKMAAVRLVSDLDFCHGAGNGRSDRTIKSRKSNSAVHSRKEINPGNYTG